MLTVFQLEGKADPSLTTQLLDASEKDEHIQDAIAVAYAGELDFLQAHLDPN